jgi:hypothetical protein
MIEFIFTAKSKPDDDTIKDHYSSINSIMTRLSLSGSQWDILTVIVGNVIISNTGSCLRTRCANQFHMMLLYAYVNR